MKGDSRILGNQYLWFKGEDSIYCKLISYIWSLADKVAVLEGVAGTTPF